MELKEIKRIPNLQLMPSTESVCYVHKDVIYKMFKSNINVKDRTDIIKYFIEIYILGCPEVYDFIYENNEIVGYMMKYYKNAVPLSEIDRFKIRKEKCLELIELYSTLKNNDLCYYDFNNSNVYVNHGNILLLDIDGCLKRNIKNEQISRSLLKEYIIGIIYKTFFFDLEVYFTFEERKQIRDTLFKNIEGKDINSIDDLKEFIIDVSKTDVRKVLKKIPYKIK